MHDEDITFDEYYAYYIENQNWFSFFKQKNNIL
jgi:hypothetical protein